MTFGLQCWTSAGSLLVDTSLVRSTLVRVGSVACTVGANNTFVDVSVGANYSEPGTIPMVENGAACRFVAVGTVRVMGDNTLSGASNIVLYQNP